VPDFELTKPYTTKVYKVLKNSLHIKTNKQRNTKMKPSLKQSPCQAHESPGEEEELERTPQRNPCRRQPPGPTMSIVCSTSTESTLLSRLGSKGAIPLRGREAHSEHTRTSRHVAREGLSIIASSRRHPRTPPPPTTPPTKRDINCQRRKLPKMR
jgi:hypothetical protein